MQEVLSAIKMLAQQMEERFQGLEARIDFRFSEVDDKFKKVDERFTAVDRRFDEQAITLDFLVKHALDSKQEHAAVIAWLERSDKRHDHHEQEIGRIKEKIGLD